MAGGLNPGAPTQLAAAVAHHAAGRLDEARRLYEALLRDTPQLVSARHNLGVLLLQSEGPASALPHLRTALEALPQQAEHWHSYVQALAQAGELAAARGAIAQAEAAGLPAALTGALAERVGAVAASLAGGAGAHRARAIALEGQGRHAEAAAAWRDVAGLLPDDVEVLFALGVCLHRAGDTAGAGQAYRDVLQRRPQHADALNNLGVVQLALGQPAQALASYRAAAAADPACVSARVNLGDALCLQGSYAQAETCLREALALAPGQVDAHNLLAGALKFQGRHDEALGHLRTARGLAPQDLQVHSNLLAAMQEAGRHSPQECLEEALAFGRAVQHSAGPPFTSWLCEPAPARLKVGIVSGDLRGHPVGYFVEAVLARLHRSRVELVAYPTQPGRDEVTERLARCFQAWTPLHGLDDEAAAHRIRSDGVHLLVDLSGHTRGQRLGVFARKPAPVQLSWLGYFATTGLEAMDYLLGDPIVTPPQAAAHFVEALWPLPETFCCFTPPPDAPAPGSLPALASGHISFGCFNNLLKINDAVAALWARVLRAVPSSRLVLDSRGLAEPAVRDGVIERFGRHGIGAGRLVLQASADRTRLLAAYGAVDIALDPFPYPGGTTTAEGLWMGVPVVGRRGDRFISCIGESLLTSAGLADWIAADDDEYVALAVARAADKPALARLRAGLRAQLAASPLFDAGRFARHLEQAWRGMWEQRGAGRLAQGGQS